MRLASIFIVVLLIFQACQFPSFQNAAFAYLDIDEHDFNASFDQGSANHSFRDVWVYADGEILGNYEIPAKVPVLLSESEDRKVIEIQAGIRDNGINSFPRIYPFSSTYRTEINIAEGRTIPLVPEFNYQANTNFRFVADFESENPFDFNEDGNDSTAIQLTDENVSTGLSSGKIQVNADSIFEKATRLVYNDIPVNGSPIYLEVDFAGNRDLDIGLIGIQEQQFFKEYFVGLRATDEWKKVYINLTDLILASRFSGYQILIGVDNSAFDTEAIIFVDNIKLLHF